MFNKRKLHVISFNYRVSTTKERKFRTTCRALNCFAEKGNRSLKLSFAQMQSNKFKKLHIIYTKGKSFP